MESHDPANSESRFREWLDEGGKRMAEEPRMDGEGMECGGRVRHERRHRFGWRLRRLAASGVLLAVDGGTPHHNV